MSFDNYNVFTKENLDLYLKELGREFRRLNGKRTPAEIILIGGAAILASYGFRDMTTDVDAVIHASSVMKDAIQSVQDKFGLPSGWLNCDFMTTGSYSTKLDEVSIYYKTFSNILDIRVVSAEYLIAMKLRSGRKYRNDLSDVVGILSEHQKRGIPISKEKIIQASIYLYGDWDKISQDSKKFLDDVFKHENYENLYFDSMNDEKKAKDALLTFEHEYQGAINESNANDIIALLINKK